MMTTPYRYAVEVQLTTTRVVEIESNKGLTYGEIHDLAVDKAKHEYGMHEDTIIRTGAIACVSAPDNEPRP